MKFVLRKERVIYKDIYERVVTLFDQRSSVIKMYIHTFHIVEKLKILGLLTI